MTKPLKFGNDRHAIALEVVRLRDEQRLSWQKISYRMPEYTSIPIAYMLYDEIKGKGAHHGRLPGKGGRVPEKARG